MDYKTPKAGDPVPSEWRDWFRVDKAHSEPWRKEAREAFDFVAGRQWSDEDQAKLRLEMRPAITFNRASIVIEAVAGNELQNRREVRYLPREEGDAIPNEIYSEAARWFDDESDAEDEDSDAFFDTLVTGMGWTETRLDFDENPDGDPVTEKIDPIEMYWDASARRVNLSDATRMWRVEEVSRAKALREWPDYSIDEIDAGKWAEDTSKQGMLPDDPALAYSQESEADEAKDFGTKKVKIVQLQWCDYEQHVRYVDPMTGEIASMSAGKWKEMKKALAAHGIPEPQSQTYRKKRIKKAFIGSKVLWVGDAPCPDRFSWNCITGKWDRNKRHWFGLVRAMKDPQMWANKWLSQVLHIMNSNATGGLLYEQGAFVNQRAAEADWAKPNSMIEMKPGALAAGRVQPKPGAQFPQGYQMLTEYAVSAIRDVTGVSLELLGMREATQPGVLEYQRKQAGMAVLSGLFNNLRRYRKKRAQVLLYYIQNYLSDGRLIRIVGQDKEQYVPLVRQSASEFDVIVDDAPSSPNQKEIVWQSLMGILPGIKDMVPPQVLLELLDYSPVPASVVAKIKEVVSAPDAKAEEAAKAQAQAALLALQKTQAEIGKIESETIENQADAAKKQADAMALQTVGVVPPVAPAF